MSKRLVLNAAAALCTLLASAGAQTFQSVYSFPANQSEGRRIASALTVGPDGALYGTATEGGAGGSGTAFKITTEGAPVRGSFAEDGTAIAAVRFSKKSKGLLFLGFRPDEPGSLLGIAVGTELWLGDARPLQARPPGLAEQFTVLTETVNVPPAGLGYALLRVLPNGLVGAVGKHADGTRLSWSTSLVTQPDGSIALPVFNEPVKGGVCAGVLVSPDSAAQTFAGALRWVRPGSASNKPYASGFDGQLTALVSSFTPAISSAAVLDFGSDASGSITIGAGYLTSPVAAGFGIAANKTTPASPVRKLSFNRKKGTFKGEAQVGPVTLKFGGVVNQQGNVAAGHFKIGGETGPVIIQP